MGEYAANYQLIQGNLFDIDDPSRLAKIWEQLNGISEFVEFRRKNGVATFAFNKYIQFRGGEGSAPARHKEAQTYPVSLSRKHPCQAEFEAWLIENGTPEGSVQTYSEAVKRIGDYLLKTGKEYRHLFSIFGVSRLEHIREALQQDQSYADKVGKKHTGYLYQTGTY